jgi:radical SAM superfamily enzyme YgiQ (UPF0313 family)
MLKNLCSKENPMAVSQPPYDVWLCDLTHTKQTIASNSVPLGIGLIAAYGKKKLGDKINFKLFKYPEKLIEELLQAKPAIIGFSNYVWNLDLGYSIAAYLKRLNPATVVVFGGPNYPIINKFQEIFLNKRKMIDFYIYREGEQTFVNLVSALIDNNFDIQKTKKSTLGNCHYLINNHLVADNNNNRIELNEIPSAYTTGILDEFFDGKLMPLIHTNRGCPFSCIFCTESEPYYNKVIFRNPEFFKSDLEYVAQHHQGNKNIDITDSNFGMYKGDLIIAEAIAEIKEKYDYPDYIHVATGKSNKERVLEAARITGGLFRLSASVQSTDPTVLKNIKRNNIVTASIIEIAKTAGKLGSNTYAEIILALPGDTKERHFKSIEDVINHNLNFIRCYTLMMLKGTGLDSEETESKYKFTTKYRVLPRCFGVYEFGSDKIISVETEKVCVATDTLSFDDYIECRCFALTIEIFYNDGILSELLSCLSHCGILPYNFLKMVHDQRNELPEVLSQLYKEFMQETVDELWDSEDKLLEFAKNENIIKKYMEGEYGSNLIFKYKALAFIKYMREIHGVAFKAARDLIGKKPIAEKKELLEFLEELEKYSLFKKANVLETNQDFEDTFRYNFLAAELNDFKSQLNDLKFSKPVKFKFYHDKQQKDIIDGNAQEFGLSIVGIARILSRVHVKKMYRQVLMSDDMAGNE